MSSLVRRFAPRPLTPTRGQGPPTEVELVDGPAESDKGAGFDVQPDGKITPRHRRFVAGIAPPPPSTAFRRDPGYARVGIISDTVQRAIVNHRAWEERHAGATNQMAAWLASADLLGEEARAAHTARQRSGRARAQARAAVAAARTALAEAEQHLSEAVATYLESDRASLPTGADIIVARQAVAAAELVLGPLEAACQQAHQRWGRSLARVDWAAVLAQTEGHAGPEAEAAAVWLRSKVSPPPDPTVDPIGWALT